MWYVRASPKRKVGPNAHHVAFFLLSLAVGPRIGLVHDAFKIISNVSISLKDFDIFSRKLG